MIIDDLLTKALTPGIQSLEKSVASLAEAHCRMETDAIGLLTCSLHQETFIQCTVPKRRRGGPGGGKDLYICSLVATLVHWPYN